MRKMRPCTASCSAFPLRSAWPALTAPRWQKTKIANPPCLPQSWLLSAQLPFPLHQNALGLTRVCHQNATRVARHCTGSCTICTSDCHWNTTNAGILCHRQLRIVAVRSAIVATASYELLQYVLPPPATNVASTFCHCCHRPATKSATCFRQRRPLHNLPAPSIRGCTMSLQHPARRPPTTSGAF